MNNCLFCQIKTGEIPAQKVYEDEQSLAFLDINPINRGHVLLIPKEHFENIHEIPEETLKTLATNIKKLSGSVKDAVSADGINIGMNNGEAAGQVIFHAHIHIIPRFTGDGHEHWKSSFEYSENEAEETAAEIQKLLTP